MIDILYLVENANLQGGTEILTFNLMRALRAQGVNAFILSLEKYEGSNSYVYSLPERDFFIWNNKRNALFNKLLFNKISDKILRSALEHFIEKNHVKYLVNQTYDLISALPSNIPVAQVFNWSVTGYEDSLLNGIKGNFLSCLLRKLVFKGVFHRWHNTFHKIPKLVILTESASAEIKGINSKVRETQFQIIPDPLIYSADNLLHSKLDNQNIIYVGRLSKEKGVMRLLRVWKRISEVVPDCTLSIYGEGNAKQDMLCYIADNKIQRVFFKGFCNDLVSIYKNADLLCMTSDTEGFGMVLIEAMYFGVPCISFDCPISPKEIIAEAGIVIPCFDEEAYANAVIAILSNKTELHKLQKKGIMRARDFYMSDVVESWKGLISKN